MDNLSLSYRSESVDHAISIAVIHHFVSPERRHEAIRECLRILRVGGTILIFVWALEQENKKSIKYSESDVLIPWYLAHRFVLESEQKNNMNDDNKHSDENGNDDASPHPSSVIPEKENVVLDDGTTIFASPAVRSPQPEKPRSVMSSRKKKQIQKHGKEVRNDVSVGNDHEVVRNGGKFFQRYYHLFNKGELEGLCEDLPCAIIDSGFANDNHFVLLRKS